MRDFLKPLILFGVILAGWALTLLGIWPATQSTSGVASPQTQAPQSAAFQPVPNTSPVPTDFLKKAVAAATPVPGAGASGQAPSVSTRPPGSSRMEFFLFQSAALDRPMHYIAYLPANYDTQPNRHYPVLYMLHGIGGGLGGIMGNETEWPGYGITAAADRLIASGQIQPLIMIFPEGDQGFWMDAAGDGPKYGKYTSEDLLHEVDGRFRTIPDRNHRAIGGLSMGGFGALALAMQHPDLFRTAGAHSPSLNRLQNGPAFFGNQAYFDAHDPVALLRDHPDTAMTLNLWLDVANQDPLWRVSTEALHQQLVAENIPHQWHEWPGQHNGVYWGEHMDDYLAFYNASLQST